MHSLDPECRRNRNFIIIEESQDIFEKTVRPRYIIDREGIL